MINWLKLQNGSDIRGVAMPGIEGEDVNLTPEIAAHIAFGFARWLKDKYPERSEHLRVSIGHDSRLTANDLLHGLTRGLAAAGIEAHTFGLASTPAMFMSAVTEGYRYDGAIMITASHLPFNRNGFKFFTADGGLEKADIKAILTTASESEAPAEVAAEPEVVGFMDVYAAQLVEIIRKGANDPKHYDEPLKGLRIPVDAGNGAGGFFVESVLKPLGADTTGSQFLEPDGRFPNHIPNPENTEAMAATVKMVKENNADLGIIFDTDVDRAGAVDSEGNEINRNRLIALLAAILLEDHPGTTIVTDSITSDELNAFITEKGGKHHRFKRGYRNVINESIRLNREGTDSQLAIETSGHGAFKENYFLDDGAYIIAKILIKIAQLKHENRKISDLIADLSEPAEAYEFRMTIKADDFKPVGEEVLRKFEAFAEAGDGMTVVKPNYEGVRVAFDEGAGNGWCLLRLSLHDPILPLNIESRDAGGAKRIAAAIIPVLTEGDQLDTEKIEAFVNE